MKIGNLKRGFKYLLVLSFVILVPMACTEDNIIDDVIDDDKPEIIKPEKEPVGSVLPTIEPDVNIVKRATKICQLTGDFDKHLKEPTLSQTESRYRLTGTDLGVPFQDGDITWLLFGDSWGPKPGLPDIIGYTKDKNPEEGLKIDLVTDVHGVYEGIKIPGVNTFGPFEVPTAGLVIEDEFFIWCTTDHSEFVGMGRSVVASTSRAGMYSGQFERLLYSLSTTKFINVSIVEVKSSDWDLLPQNDEDGIIMFGSGTYRSSHIYLAYQPLSGIKSKHSIRYYAGMKDGKPLWNKDEADAVPIFYLNNPGVGELSATYNKFIKEWILLYNHGEPRGINLRTSDTPWGPWSNVQVNFDPWDDNGYCHFMHTSHEFRVCDHVHDPGRENEWGGEYGPYQFGHFAIGNDESTTIYFTMSTWNPYDVVLMKTSLTKRVKWSGVKM